METVKTISQVRKFRKNNSSTLGLVPTMGYLHEGHLSLCRMAKSECDYLAVSIFVNPTQFGPKEDLGQYPRDLQKDLEALEKIGTNLVFVPEPFELYPSNFQTYVNVEEVTKYLEGSARPVHFRGVATIVTKLFNIFEPQKSYFGQKDAQQAVVIKRLVKDLNFPIDIVVCPIVREPDGLAMSSRNTYLTPDQRKAATVLYRSLMLAKKSWDKKERDCKHLLQTMEKVLLTEPLAKIEYISASDPNSLVELQGTQKSVLLSMAIRIGKTRLIDNLLLNRQ